MDRFITVLYEEEPKLTVLPSRVWIANDDKEDDDDKLGLFVEIAYEPHAFVTFYTSGLDFMSCDGPIRECSLDKIPFIEIKNYLMEKEDTIYKF